MKFFRSSAGVLLGMGIILAGSALAQTGALVPLPLQDLSGFAPTGANWKVVGNATSSRTVNQDLKTQPGTGTLANVMTDKDRANLVSAFSHGDIDLELEVMMPKGSNSGIYLQGRYEVQLYDSWASKDAAHSDMGGIYQRWDESRPKQPYDLRGYEGKAPRVNACKAPGLWQKLKISFQAPRFDASGKKLSNAKFLRVILNDALLHEQVECSGPTRGSVSAQEVAQAPFLIQGDHGPVAFRNIKYRLYSGEAPTWQALNYKIWYGDFTQLSDFMGKKPALEGKSNALTWTVSAKPDQYAIQYIGKLNSPEAGEVKTVLGIEGKCRLVVNGKVIVDTNGAAQRWWKRLNPTISLQKGLNDVELIVFKSASKNLPSIELRLEGDGFRQVALHDERSLPDQAANEWHYLNPEARTRTQRVFSKLGNAVRPYTIAVGSPKGVNYFYDLSTANVTAIWRGGFLNMQGLWDSRGSDQIAWPVGAPTYLSGAPVAYKLNTPEAVWPDSLTDKEFRHERYQLSREGNPVFEHRIQGIKLIDKLEPQEGQAAFTRTLQADQAMTARIAVGTNISLLTDGSYLVQGADHYIMPFWGKDVKPIIRTSNGKMELLVPVAPNAPLAYQIIW